VGIVYTQHAKDRMLERGIKKEWIEEAIKNPDEIKKGKENKRIVVKAINNKKINVVYPTEKYSYIIITTYWGK
jgi:hypothetical protein